MRLIVTVAPWLSLLAGILILAMPRLLGYVVAIYLIVIGTLELFATSAEPPPMKPAAEVRVLT